MGVIVDIFRAVVSFKFYKTVVMRGTGRALMHLLMISLLYTIAFTVFLNMQVLSPINLFVDWTAENFPTIMLQGRELTTDAQEPFFATYENFGLTFVFSTKQEFTDIGSQAPNTVVVERSRVLFVGNDNTVEEYDLASMKDLPENINVAVDSEGWIRIKVVLNKWFTPIVFLFVLIFSWIAYLVAAVIYALLGMIIGLLVRAKLDFGALAKIAIYAVTLLNLIVILGLFVPLLAFPFRGIVLFILTLGYMTAGIMVNKPEQRA
ncbi:MAG: DUF1189 family protein [Candidatus Omnitrophica bacterium]|nr:DUF1189 family protein [Candidatus Omnitrophota bacterium]